MSDSRDVVGTHDRADFEDEHRQSQVTVEEGDLESPEIEHKMALKPPSSVSSHSRILTKTDPPQTECSADASETRRVKKMNLVIPGIHDHRHNRPHKFGDVEAGQSHLSEEEWVEIELSINGFESSDRNREDLGGQDFLAKLDDLEAARPNLTRETTIMPGDRNGIWEQPNFHQHRPVRRFDNWVDEADSLEATASMPEGTRFYKVKESSVFEHPQVYASLRMCSESQ
ncbi:hypothetical protein F5Y18DRAFT_386337 [Xylariaceae sp. FL1019]|nr:hypothetical protein F5Y18DRAFT_386337 [Xylariaceae sp. FL1019]